MRKAIVATATAVLGGASLTPIVQQGIRKLVWDQVFHATSPAAAFVADYLPAVAFFGVALYVGLGAQNIRLRFHRTFLTGLRTHERVT
jgi:hypothetical protein